tara:strand:- start:13 stop:300 length:288 start_codon:yes stop_codon:yes gene_type:complete
MTIKDKKFAIELLKQQVKHNKYELLDCERALDSLTKKERFTNQASKEEILDTIGYLYNDYYTYPKERMYNAYNEIMNVDFDKVKNFLEKNGVDTY